MQKALLILSVLILAVACDKQQKPPVAKPVPPPPPPPVNVWMVELPEKPDEKLVREYLSKIPETGVTLTTHGEDTSPEALHCLAWLLRDDTGNRGRHFAAHFTRFTWTENGPSIQGRVSNFGREFPGIVGRTYFKIHAGPEDLVCPSSLFTVDAESLETLTSWVEAA